MSDYKLSVILIVLFVGYVVFRPLPKFPAPVTAPPGASAPAPGQCVSPADLEEMKRKCTPESAKEDIRALKARMDDLDKEVAGGFNDLAETWQKAQDHRKDERELIIRRLKTEIMTGCPGVR